jgi:prepilin-type N-terminal cleavage/methylation domain-containing protein
MQQSHNIHLDQDYTGLITSESGKAEGSRGSHRLRSSLRKVAAFTLIELLVVIAIIGILAAIIFPVYARVKDSANRNSDMSNLNAIRTALQLYKADQGAYPPQLLGYVSLYQSGPNMGNVIPANQLVTALYPKRIDSIQTLRPNYLTGNDATFTATTTAVWPFVQDSLYGQTDPTACYTVNTAGPVPRCSLQEFRPADGNVSTQVDSGSGLTVLGAGYTNVVQYYSVSGYETALVKSPSGPIRELRYAPFWTGFGLDGGSGNDEVRQLGYNEPPETTVVTWDSYFRDYDANGVPLGGEKREIVLFVGGAARPFDSSAVYNNAFQTKP